MIIHIKYNDLRDLKLTYNKSWLKKYKNLTIHEKINFKSDYFFFIRANPHCKVWYAVTGVLF